MFKTLLYYMARSFSETACQPNPGLSRPHSLGPMLQPRHVPQALDHRPQRAHAKRSDMLFQ